MSDCPYEPGNHPSCDSCEELAEKINELHESIEMQNCTLGDKQNTIDRAIKLLDVLTANLKVGDTLSPRDALFLMDIRKSLVGGDISSIPIEEQYPFDPLTKEERLALTQTAWYHDLSKFHRMVVSRYEATVEELEQELRAKREMNRKY